MAWCKKWVNGSEFPDGVEVTLGRDGNVRRYTPERTCHDTGVRYPGWTCSNCGHVDNYALNYCPNCGMRVVERTPNLDENGNMTVCSDCGAELSKTNPGYCWNCGAKVVE